MKICAENTQLLLIDVQERLMGVMHEKEQLEARLLTLLSGLELLNIPCTTSQQYTKGLGETIPSLLPFITSERFEKSTFSCCQTENLHEALKQSGKKTILLAGIEAHICVLQTALDLKEKGYEPVIIADCVASRDPYQKEIALQRLIQSGITPTTCESVLFELTGGATHEAFRAISKLIK